VGAACSGNVLGIQSKGVKLGKVSLRARLERNGQLLVGLANEEANATGARSTTSLEQNISDASLTSLNSHQLDFVLDAASILLASADLGLNLGHNLGAVLLEGRKLGLKEQEQRNE
jgi:hypothetical protein